MAFLGIDAGASATKWSVTDGDRTIAQGRTLPMDGHIYKDTSLSRIREVLTEIAEKTEGIKSVYAGITGLSLAEKDYAITKSLFAEYFPSAKFTGVSDMELAYRAHLEPGEGILIYAGTGSIAVHITKSGELKRMGGWGYLLGDEGAGYWIGREAIRSCLYALEMGEPLSHFHETIFAELEAKDWVGIRNFVYSEHRSAIASLSRFVSDEANSGENAAKTILDGSAHELNSLRNRMQHLLGSYSHTIVLAGGVLTDGSYAANALMKLIGTQAVIGNADIAAKAALLAAKL